VRIFFPFKAVSRKYLPAVVLATFLTGHGTVPKDHLGTMLSPACIGTSPELKNTPAS